MPDASEGASSGKAGESSEGESPIKQPVAESQWVVASKEVRETARWVVTLAAGAAGVIFGGAPLIGKADLTGEYVPQRVMVILAAATLGVLGLAGIIGTTARVLLPYETTLADLPSPLKERIEGDPASYLPGDLPNVQRFREDLQWWSTQARQLPADVARLEARLESAKALPDTDPTKTRKVAEIEEELAVYQEAADVAVGNLAIFEQARDDILGQAGFTKVSDLWSGSGPLLVVCGVLAVLGAVVYVMAIGFEPDESDEVDQSTSARPALALLSRRDDGASDALWDAAGLADCEVPGDHATPVVPVLLDAGAGTPEEPYVVQTLPVTDGCPIVRFSVIDAVATLTIPADDLTITYQLPTTGS